MLRQRTEAVGLLMDSLAISIRKATLFAVEFDDELHPAKTLAKGWRYAQDILHDFQVAMGPHLSADFWCEQASRLLAEIGNAMTCFIDDTAEIFGIVEYPQLAETTDGQGVDEGEVDERKDASSRAILKQASAFAAILQEVLSSIRSRVETLKISYEVEFATELASITAGAGS